MAGQKNFEVDQNATFSFVLEYRDNDGNAIDLTGASAKMQVRDTKGGAKLAVTLTSPSGGIVINPVNGKLTIKMTPTEAEDPANQLDLRKIYYAKYRKSDEIKKKAVKAKEALKTYLDGISWLRFDGFDKYGRVLGTLFQTKEDTVSVNQKMIDDGHGYVYNGGTKQTL